MANKSSRNNLLLGGGAVFGVLIFLAILAVIQYVVINNPKRWDLTGSSRYTLAPQSTKILNDFKEKNLPIDVLAFYETKDINARDQAKDLLEQYRDAYSNVKISMIDPDKDRSLALKNKVESYPTIIIKAGNKEERITAADEENVTNALVKLTRTEEKKVYFLKGHGELSPTSSEADGFSAAKSYIEKQNYKTEELVLLQTPEVPADASMVIVAGPKTDLQEPEFDSLKRYLQRGGSLLILLNPFKTPQIGQFLANYGIEAGNDIVVDRMSRVFGGDFLIPVITTYVKFPITKDFTLASFFPETRSVKAAEKPKPEITAQNLALTSQLSWTISEEQLNSGKADFDPGTGVQGPISVMAVSQVTNEPEATKRDPAVNTTEKTESEPPNKPKKARIVVTGSALFASNKIIQGIQANRELLLNSVSWLAEDENLIAIRPKNIKAQPIVLSGYEPLIILIIPVVLVPLAWVIAGIAVYVYRRRTAVL